MSAARPRDMLGQARKGAMRRAWSVAASLVPSYVAKRLGISVSLLRAYLKPSSQNLPRPVTLRGLARLYREHAHKLTQEADRLDSVAGGKDE